MIYLTALPMRGLPTVKIFQQFSAMQDRKQNANLLKQIRQPDTLTPAPPIAPAIFSIRLAALPQNC
jgi:hypothetical protein